jgi:sugar O-acyltransferase (sialic acid O-acetyltransferase NeuD family)
MKSKLIKKIYKEQKNINKIILFGGTGQSKVVKPIIEYNKAKIIAVFDDTAGLKSPFKNVPLYTGFKKLIEWASKVNPKKIGFVITIGNPHGNKRIELHKKLLSMGFKPYKIIDPSAIIANDCKIGDGVQILAGSIIMPEVKIGNQCIINTGASIDHECILKNGVEISPGSILCGNVILENNSWVGAGSTILPRLTIGTNSIVGAGSVVTKNIDKNLIVTGIPAKIYKKIKRK